MAGPAFSISNVGPSGLIPFGSVAQGQSLTFYLPIKNLGSIPLVIAAATVTLVSGKAGDFFLSNFSPGLAIGPGATDESLSLTFRPTDAFETAEQATVTFKSNSISGLQTFTLTGKCVELGTSVSNPVSGSIVVSESQTGDQFTGHVFGSDVATNAAFPSVAVSPAQTVSVIMQVSENLVGGSPSPPFTGGCHAGLRLEYSSDVGATWTTFYTAGVDATQTLNDTTTAGFALVGIVSDLNQIQVRATATCDVNSLNSLTATATATISNFSAQIITSGDSWIQAIQTDAFPKVIAPVLNFGDVIVGGTYTSNAITVTNPSTGPVAVSLSADTAMGFSIVNQTGSLILSPLRASTLTFQVQLVPVTGGAQDDTEGFTVTLTVSGEQFTYEAFYVAPPIVPAFILQGDVEATVLALKTPVSSSVLASFNPQAACEDAAALSKQYYVDQAYLNKMFNRLWLLYERFGAFTLTLNASVVNPKGVPVKTATVTGSSATDGLLAIGALDLQLTGSCLNLAFALAANAGIVSLAGYVMKVDEGGEVIENT